MRTLYGKGQHGDRAQVIGLVGQIERGLAFVVTNVWVGSVFKQQRYGIGAVSGGRVHKSRSSFYIFAIQICMVLDQYFDRFLAAMGGCFH